MVYAYDLWAQMPVKDLYDTQMMLASVNAAKDMYEKAEAELKEFKKDYWDFVTASKPDQQWFDDNFVKAYDDLVKNADKLGVDLTRSISGRAMLRRFINSRPIAVFAQVKQTAKTADEFYKNMATLQQNNLYNPELSQYEGGMPSEYSTINAKKPWELRSPTPYRDMGLFAKSYFDKLQPSTSVQTKNGVRYTSSDITEEDLHRIADDAFNDLVKTGLGLLMYKQFLDRTGGDENKARLMFNDTVVAGNLQRIHHSDDYVQNLNTALNRQLQQSMQNMRNELAKMRIDAQKEIALLRANSKNGRSSSGSSSGRSSSKQQFSALRAMLSAGSAAILRQDTDAAKHLDIVSASDFSPRSAEGWMPLAQATIARNVFGADALKNVPKMLYGLRYNDSHGLTSFFPSDTFGSPKADLIRSTIHPLNLNFVAQMSTPFSKEDLKVFYDRENYKIDGDDKWFTFYPEDVHAVYTADEIASMVEGNPIATDYYTDFEKTEGDRIRNIIKTQGINAMRGADYILSPVGKDGKLHVYAKITLGKFDKGVPATVAKNGQGEYNSSVSIPDALNRQALYIDTGITTTGLGSLDLDESLTSMSGAINLDKKWGSAKNQQNNDIDFINNYGDDIYDDLFDDDSGDAFSF